MAIKALLRLTAPTADINVVLCMVSVAIIVSFDLLLDLLDFRV